MWEGYITAHEAYGTHAAAAAQWSSTERAAAAAAAADAAAATAAAAADAAARAVERKRAATRLEAETARDAKVRKFAGQLTSFATRRLQADARRAFGGAGGRHNRPAEQATTEVFAQGDTVWYADRQAGGALREATVTEVYRDDIPPYYTIHFTGGDGGTRQTVRENLSARAST